MDDPSPSLGSLPRFLYRAAEPVTGIEKTGELAGENAFAIRAILRRSGLKPLAVVRINQTTRALWTKPFYDAWDGHLRSRCRSQIADLFQSLATLLKAGVTLDDALAITGGSPTRAPVERLMIARLRDGIRDGHPLSAAASLESKWFDPFDVALLDAGQQAGDLPATLQAAASHHKRAGNIGQRLFVALAYPGILAVAGIGVAMFLGHQVLPQLALLLQQAHQPVPGLTTGVIITTQTLWWSWPFFALVTVVIVLGILRLVQRIPTDGPLGRFVHGNALARLRRRYRAGRFAWSLARLLGAGMTMTDALAVVADSLQDVPLRELINESQAAIVRGEDFSAVIGRSPLLDPEVAQLIRIGERGGELVPILEQIADHAFTAADAAMDRVAALVGPFAILILAVIIGFLALACILPLSRLGDIL